MRIWRFITLILAALTLTMLRPMCWSYRKRWRMTRRRMRPLIPLCTGTLRWSAVLYDWLDCVGVRSRVLGPKAPGGFPLDAVRRLVPVACIWSLARARCSGQCRDRPCAYDGVRLGAGFMDGAVKPLGIRSRDRLRNNADRRQPAYYFRACGDPGGAVAKNMKVTSSAGRRHVVPRRQGIFILKSSLLEI